MELDEALRLVPRGLWRDAAGAAHRLLMLDYDGTLAPFTVARSEARPSPGAVESLRSIAGGTRTTVAIVSGRPVRELERFVGEKLPVILVGEHGWERRDLDGRIARRPLDESTAAILEAGERLARASGWAESLERKRTAIVLHTRSMPCERARDVESECASMWRALAESSGVTIDRIDGGVELRAKGIHKGGIVRALLDAAPRGTLPVFVGDDVTDEDAFGAVRDRGYGIRVGDAERTSLATAHLPSCESVVLFLGEWLRVVESQPRRS